jgi:hypothetical protein
VRLRPLGHLSIVSKIDANKQKKKMLLNFFTNKDIQPIILTNMAG